MIGHMYISQQDVEAVIEVARAAAGQARRIRREGLTQVRSKSNEIDLVTEADIANEALIREELARLYPSCGLWGEETNQVPDAEYFWLVDPIDGTNNYAHGLPYWAVTIALQHRGMTLLGVTCHIDQESVYYARLGAGAFLRGPDGADRRLAVNEVKRLRNALLATGFPYHRYESNDNNGGEFAYFMPRCHDLRVWGAAALDIAQVASGSLAAFWEGWLGPWDAAASVLLVREAGGRVTDYAGQDLDHRQSRPRVQQWAA